MLLGFVLGSKCDSCFDCSWFCHQNLSFGCISSINIGPLSINDRRKTSLLPSTHPPYDFRPSVLIYLSPSYVCCYFILFYFYFTWGAPARPTRMYVFLLVKYLLFLLHKWDLCHTGRNGVGKRLESDTCATSTKHHVIHKRD